MFHIGLRLVQSFVLLRAFVHFNKLSLLFLQDLLLKLIHCHIH